MRRIWIVPLALALASMPARAQNPAAGACTTPASIAINGNVRLSEAAVRAQLALQPGTQLTARAVESTIRSLYATGQYESVVVSCAIDDAGTATLIVSVRERPILNSVQVRGNDVLSRGTVEGMVDLIVGQPLDPARVATAATRIDSLYESRGYVLATVTADTGYIDGAVDLTFEIEEGGRLAVSGVRINGNHELSDGDVIGAMAVKPEGFLWFRRGRYDDENYSGDLGQRIPELYASRGFIDMRILSDTLIIDREAGKALVELTVDEGPQYRVGRFDVVGNQRFSEPQIQGFYPFDDAGPTLSERVTDFIRRRERDPGVFDAGEWQSATQALTEAYQNEGYISARVMPVVDRRPGSDSAPVVDLRWEVIEGGPAIINRVEILGNDYTEEACIRRELSLLPGAVFRRDLLIASYQSLSNMGFFEAPLPVPEVVPANEEGDVDIVFQVEEKRTGNVNFGASLGQGYGLGGFIGLDQPNLFGQCKRVAVNWQFGRYINDASISYTDPAIRGSLFGGTLSAYRTRSQFIVGDLGRQLRTGANVGLRFPVPNIPRTLLSVSYGVESVEFGGDGLLGQIQNETQFDRSFRSTMSLDLTRDTRIGLPFPVAGGLQRIEAQFNGGILGGNVQYSRVVAEMRGNAPIAQIGAGGLGANPLQFTLGLTVRGGAVFGNTGPFFALQEFSLGGVQFGEQLRGYEEFSVSPTGYLGDVNAQRSSFGKSFFRTTAELGLRVSQGFYVNTFYEAGNVWSAPRQFDPSRLFRGAGVGASLITPLGPLGLDLAYGFDRTEVDALTGVRRSAPGWQVHFRLGQLFQ